MNLSNNCYNEFAGRTLLTRAQTISIAASAALLIPIQIICNAAVIIAFYKTKQLNSICNWYIVAMCLSDCFAGSVTIPLYCVLFTTFGFERVCWYEQLTMVVVQTNSHFSAYTMAVIALQRYLKARPRLSESWLTGKLVSKEGMIFTSSLVMFVSILHGIVSTNFFDTTTNITPKIIMMIFNIFIVVSVYVCYIRLYRSVKVHVANTAMLKENLPVSLRDSTIATTTATTSIPTNQPMYFNELTKTMYFILASCAVCGIPFMITDFATGWYALVLQVEAPQTVRFLYFLSFWPLALNGINNALILLYRNKKAAKYIKDCLRATFCQANEEDVQRV